MTILRVRGWAVVACFVAMAGCTQSTELSQLQYGPNIGIVRDSNARLPKYNVVYSFRKKDDGQRPTASLIDVNGTLYGTTLGGGLDLCGQGYHFPGCGTVFSVTASGQEKVLHRFGKGTDGRNPAAALVDVGGILYGTTENGGTYNSGTVFSITTGGTEKVLYSFAYHYSRSNYTDGRYPVSSLLAVNGVLYGTTEYGGGMSGGSGTVFSVTTGGTETVLHRFGGTGDGSYPIAGLTDVGGTLYGTTAEGTQPSLGCVGSIGGPGTVFSITTSGTEKVLHNFDDGGGACPAADLTDVGGVLYGTTVGGAGYGPPVGTVFSITTEGVVTLLHSFTGSTDGAYPHSSVIDVKGALYGTTFNGCPYGDGTVYSLATSGSFKVRHNFGGVFGSGSIGGLIDVDGLLYGTTEYGGAYNEGAVYSLRP